MALEFRDPVGSPRGLKGPKPKYAEEVQELKENPGQWAPVAVKGDEKAGAMMVSQIRHGRLAAFRPAGDFEGYFENGEVFAKYVGEG